MSRLIASSAWGGASVAWAVPVAIGTIGVLYQMAVGGILVPQHGPHIEFNLDLILFGVVNPLLAFVAVRAIRETWDNASRSESRAREAERLLAAISDVSPDGIIRVDADGRVMLWNKTAELLFGYLAIEAAGRPLELLVGGPGLTWARWRQLQELVTATGEVRGYEVVCCDRAGEKRQAEVAARRLQDEAGASGGMLIVLHDITRRNQRTELIESLNRGLREKARELARANAELEQAGRMRGELLSLVSHDIRAPLANLLAGAEQLRDSCGGLTPACSRMFSVFHQQVRQLDGLVRRILDAANIDAGRLVLQREPVSLGALIRQVVDRFRAGGRTRPVLVAVSGDLPHVDADRDRVADVLENLLGNADKYSPPEAEIAVEAEAGAGGVTVRVRDRGPGLPPEALERVFEKFYRADTPETRAAQGYGLGLYICRRLVAAHGGSIRADNDPRGGAVFSFTLPGVK